MAAHRVKLVLLSLHDQLLTVSRIGTDSDTAPSNPQITHAYFCNNNAAQQLENGRKKKDFYLKVQSLPLQIQVLSSTLSSKHPHCCRNETGSQC